MSRFILGRGATHLNLNLALCQLVPRCTEVKTKSRDLRTSYCSKQRAPSFGAWTSMMLGAHHDRWVDGMAPLKQRHKLSGPAVQGFCKAVRSSKFSAHLGTPRCWKMTGGASVPTMQRCRKWRKGWRKTSRKEIKENVQKYSTSLACWLCGTDATFPLELVSSLFEAMHLSCKCLTMFECNASVPSAKSI